MPATTKPMTTNETQPVLLTVTEVCELLHLSRPTVYGLINSGQLRSFKVGRVRRVPTSAVDDYVAGMVASNGGHGAA